MILDMDAGNTRLKWALHQGDIYVDAQFGDAARAQIPAVLSRFKELNIERIRLSSVVAHSTEVISDWAAQRGIAVETALVIDGAGGVACGYRQPDRLGIDRWLALLAARNLCPDSYAVVDAGTALTLDLVDESSVHLGGVIVPGLQMMMDSLGAKTWGVKVDETHDPSPVLGASTAEAVTNGCLTAVLGLIEKIMTESDSRHLFITGGDAPQLAKHFMASQARHSYQVATDPHLVLAGLSVALP